MMDDQILEEILVRNYGSSQTIKVNNSSLKMRGSIPKFWWGTRPPTHRLRRPTRLDKAE